MHEFSDSLMQEGRLGLNGYLREALGWWCGQSWGAGGSVGGKTTVWVSVSTKEASMGFRPLAWMMLSITIGTNDPAQVAGDLP